MTYTELKAAILDFLNRQDDTSIPVDTFIRIAEAKFNRLIRVRQMERRVTATAVSQFVTLPTDFLEMRNVQINAASVIPLTYLTPQEADKYRSGNPTGDPKFFSVVANRLELIPAPKSSVVEMVYYAKIPALSTSSESNWLLDRHPDVYLYGALDQSSSYLNDDNGRWSARAQSALDEILLDDQQAQFHGTTPTMRGVSIG